MCVSFQGEIQKQDWTATNMKLYYVIDAQTILIISSQTHYASRTSVTVAKEESTTKIVLNIWQNIVRVRAMMVMTS